MKAIYRSIDDSMHEQPVCTHDPNTCQVSFCGWPHRCDEYTPPSNDEEYHDINADKRVRFVKFDEASNDEDELEQDKMLAEVISFFFEGSDPLSWRDQFKAKFKIIRK